MNIQNTFIHWLQESWICHTKLQILVFMLFHCNFCYLLLSQVFEYFPLRKKSIIYQNSGGLIFYIRLLIFIVQSDIHTIRIS